MKTMRWFLRHGRDKYKSFWRAVLECVNGTFPFSFLNNNPGLLETRLSARTSTSQSAGRWGKTLPKASGGWVLCFFKSRKSGSVLTICLLRLVCNSKRLMRRRWSATWGACSWAPALEAAPTRCRALRAGPRPRASLWTAPRSPWRTVSDSTDANHDRHKHVSFLLCCADLWTS